MIKFKSGNIYDLGITDSNGIAITSDCKIKCSREQAPECRLFKMYDNVEYIILDISLRENYLDLKVHHYYYQKDDTPAYCKMFNGSDEMICKYSLGTIQDIRYFGKRGMVL